MSGKIIPNILRKVRRFPGIGPLPTLWSLMAGLETVTMPLDVSFSLLTCWVYTEDQGLVSRLISHLGPIWFKWVCSMSSGRCYGEGNGNPLQYSCLENPMDGGVWEAAVHGVAQSRTWLSYFTFTFHFHALEKEMATHSSVLAWRIPGTEEPGGLPSMGSHRVGHDWNDSSSSSSMSSGYDIIPSKVAPCPLPSCFSISF